MPSPSIAVRPAPAWRTVTDLDRVRIHRWLRSQPANASLSERLGDLIDSADEIPAREVPGDVVTMYSQVLLRDGDGSPPRKLTLCYPPDADPVQGFVSVLSPVGAALLGLRVGETASWQGPDGRTETAQVQTMLFQPEASGDYTL